jgi:hypothetical protein
MLLVTTNTITNVSAVEATNIGVYWDSGCTNRVLTIDWGNLTPGSLKNVIVYIKNEVEEPIYLMKSTTNWKPSKASDYITLGWSYTGQRMNHGETLQITLTLSVSRHIEGISSFNFDISIAGSDRLLGDINGDGIVNITDVVIVALAFGSKPGDPNWNSYADLNQDGFVNIVDIVTVAMYFG